MTASLNVAGTTPDQAVPATQATAALVGEDGNAVDARPGKVASLPAPAGQPALSFTAWGVPAPQGSHKAFVVNGRAVITQASSRTRPWRESIVNAVLTALALGPEDEQGMAERVGYPFGTGPVEVQVTFVLPRPKHHFRTGRFSDELRDNAPVFVTTTPDCDKLCRALGDALVIAGAVKDDAQIAVWQASKVYAAPGEKPGAHVFVMAAT